MSFGEKLSNSALTAGVGDRREAVLAPSILPFLRGECHINKISTVRMNKFTYTTVNNLSKKCNF